MKSDLENHQNKKNIMQVSNRKLHTNTKYMWRDEFAYEFSYSEMFIIEMFFALQWH
jgi:hypothetical protein